MSVIKKKLVVCDLDDTLLRKDQTISAYSVAVIKKYIDKGNIFCISTGRPIKGAISYYNQLGLNTIISCLNGSILLNPKDNHFLPIHLGFSKNVMQYIFSNKHLLKYVGCVLVENIDGTYMFTNEKAKYYTKEFLAKVHIDIASGETKVYKMNEFESLQKDVSSVLIYVTNKKNVDDLCFKIKGITNTLVVRSWSLPKDEIGTMIEVNSIFASKGTVVKFLSSYYLIPLTDTYSFGDGDNDLEMLLGSNGYAMKNASVTVKLLSNKITKFTNENDGVAKELRKIFKL